MILNTLRKVYRLTLKPTINRIKWSKKLPEVAQRFSKSGPKIIYAITPTPQLSNIGDQAQVVAIYEWLKTNFPEKEIVELNKDEAIHLAKDLRQYVTPEDVIVLHSGGNMGDRGIWSETSRRTMISNFPNNKIVSLPQTIHFSETPTGKKELEISKSIYNNHKDLTVVARDHISFKHANNYFPKTKTFETPDFVLSYPYEADTDKKTNGKVLFCLREDSESNINSEERKELLSYCDRPYDIFDTTIPEAIEIDARKKVLDETLQMFSNYDFIITDRFHGLIFSTLCKKPTIVLPTVDHKLTSAFDWFDEVKFLKFSKTISEVKTIISEIEKEEDRFIPDWNEKYFTPLTKFLK